MPKPLSLSEFKFEKITFEIRFNDAYLIWDKAGIIWSEFSKIWPNLKLGQATPGVTSFTWENRISFQIELGKAFVISFKPNPSLEEFKDIAEKFEAIIKKYLEINQYTRVGVRCFYNKQYENVKSASAEIVASLGVPFPEGKHFNIEGNLVATTLTHRWEDEYFGVISEIKSEGQKLDLLPPIDLADELKTPSIERSRILFSVDYYSLAPVKVSQLSVQKWIDNAYHLIKRDHKVFLEK